MDVIVEGSRPRGRLMKTRVNVVEEDIRLRGLVMGDREGCHGTCKADPCICWKTASKRLFLLVVLSIYSIATQVVL